MAVVQEVQRWATFARTRRPENPGLLAPYGEEFFEHLGHHGEHEAAFQASMAGRADQEADDVVAAYDFSGFGRVVDGGGGRGVLLARILHAAGGASGVLVDRPAAIPAARSYMESAGLADWSACLAGDFFSFVPPDADAYVLSRILHERARDRPAAIRMDLHMLLLLGARERTETEFRVLLERNGFRVERLVPTVSPAGLGVIEAVLE